MKVEVGSESRRKHARGEGRTGTWRRCTRSPAPIRQPLPVDAGEPSAWILSRPMRPMTQALATHVGHAWPSISLLDDLSSVLAVAVYLLATAFSLLHQEFTSGCRNPVNSTRRCLWGLRVYSEGASVSSLPFLTATAALLQHPTNVPPACTFPGDTHHP